MRGILFRGKRIDNGDWLRGYLWIGNDHSYIMPDNVGISYYEKEQRIMAVAYEVDPETVCQYTGLTDKNGRKIFEGDIVRRTDLHNTKEPSVGFIEYDAENTAFLIHWTDVQNYSATFPWKDKIEVIGNIFDNPELLSGGKK